MRTFEAKADQEVDFPKIQTKCLWNEKEDKHLIEVVNTHGPKNWNFIASFISDRSAKQCRERWHNHLNPTLKKGEWSLEEDLLIITQTKKIGFKWSFIARLLPGRADNDIKNRYNRFLKKHVESDKYKNLCALSTSAVSSISSPVSSVTVSSPVSPVSVSSPVSSPAPMSVSSSPTTRNFEPQQTPSPPPVVAASPFSKTLPSISSWCWSQNLNMSPFVGSQRSVELLPSCSELVESVHIAINTPQNNPQHELFSKFF